jgi:hypothetical protein
MVVAGPLTDCWTGVRFPPAPRRPISASTRSFAGGEYPTRRLLRRNQVCDQGLCGGDGRGCRPPRITRRGGSHQVKRARARAAAPKGGKRADGLRATGAVAITELRTPDRPPPTIHRRDDRRGGDTVGRRLRRCLSLLTVGTAHRRRPSRDGALAGRSRRGRSHRPRPHCDGFGSLQHRPQQTTPTRGPGARDGGMAVWRYGVNARFVSPRRRDANTRVVGGQVLV